MPIKDMTPEEIKQATQEQVLASAKSTDKANRLPGETASEANARITAAYKQMQAKPVLSQEQIDAGAKVQYVRTGAGGVGEYTVVKPPGYTGPTITKDFTEGVLRPDLFYTTVNGQGGVKTTGATGATGTTSTGGNVKTLPNGSYTIVSKVKRADGGYDVTYRSADGKEYTKTEYSTFGDNTGSAGGNTQTPTGPTLASNTFKTTLGLFFGQAEMSKPWVDELYKLTAPYYKSGSTVDEALNLALQQGRNNPNLKEFTTRFKGIFDLQDKLVSGQAITVPTIAEFVATEAKMGDVLTQAGLGSLNQQAFLGDIIGKGVNAVEFANRVNNVYLRIDQMPQQVKDFISSTFPTLDKAQLAKTILTGDKGAIQLAKELGGMEVQAAAKAQGLTESTAGGLDIAARGYGYQEALAGFGQVAQGLPTTQKLLEMRTGTKVATEDAQRLLEQNVFYKNAAEQERLRKLAEEETARYGTKSGNIGSRAFASQQRGAGLL